MLPRSTQYKNVRSRIADKDWQRLRHTICQNDRCCFCEATGKDQGFAHAFELHEVWEFGKKQGKPVQVLVDLQPLCPMCHKIAHVERTMFLIEKDMQNALDMESKIETRAAYDKFAAHYRKVMKQDVNIGLKSIRNRKRILPDGEYMIDLTYLNRFEFLGGGFTDDEKKFDLSKKYNG